ncbi:MAG: ABC transporter permease [Ktedonobacteraceae bacterium]
MTSPDVSEQEKTGVWVSTGGAANQQTLRNIGLITVREYKNRVRQRSYLISTIVLMVLLIIAACVPTLIQFFSSKTSSQTHITIVNGAGSIAGLSDAPLTQYISASLNGSSTQPGSTTSEKSPYVLQMGTADQVDSLRQSVKNGKLDILLVLARASDQSLQFTYYTNVSASADSHDSQIQALAGQLSVFDKSVRLGLTPQQTSSLFAPPGFTFVNTQQGARSTQDQLVGYFIAYAGVLLIFMSIFLYGNGVAVGAAEEKSSRIMEILVNAATPFQLMAGKIIGIGAAGLTQMACLVALGIGALLLQSPLQNILLGTTTNAGLSFSFTGVSINLLLLVLLYFILGFLLYATLFAALGALVKRQDEVQTAVQPLTWLFMIGYIASLVGGAASANTTWMKVLSFVPFWTPTIMLMRVGAGSVSAWEIIASVLIMLVSIAICAVISARIYRFAVLMYGQRPNLRQLVRIVRTQ